MLKTALFIGMCALTLLTRAQTLTENFDNVFGLYTTGNWYTLNKSNPSNGNIWYQDAGNFTAHSGASNSSITAGWYCTDTVGTGTASVWLFTPPLNFTNGDSISFYTISYNNAQYPDRLELRMNTSNTDTLVGPDENSIGDYTHLLLTINPALDTTSYPMIWTKYTAVISGISPAYGRLAFRYFVPNTGGSGINGSVVGIDDFMFKPAVSNIGETQSAIHVDVYPNPVKDFVTVSSDVTITSISLADFAGRLCYTETVNQKSIAVDCSKHDKGMYILTVTTNAGSVSRKISID